MLTLESVHHIAVICSDYRRSLDFYTRVLGFGVVDEVYRAERQSWMTRLALNGDYLIELFTFPSPPPRVTGPEAAGLRHLAFAVDDIVAAVAELDRLGVAHEELRTNAATSKRFLFFHDPDGLPIELCER